MMVGFVTERFKVLEDMEEKSQEHAENEDVREDYELYEEELRREQEGIEEDPYAGEEDVMREMGMGHVDLDGEVPEQQQEEEEEGRGERNSNERKEMFRNPDGVGGGKFYPGYQWKDWSGMEKAHRNIRT